MKIQIEYRAFETHPITIEFEHSFTQKESEDSNFVLEDLFRAFNHAIPGETGELAERFKVRSMSVGDRISFDVFDGKTFKNKTFECVAVGWKEIKD